MTNENTSLDDVILPRLHSRHGAQDRPQSGPCTPKTLDLAISNMMQLLHEHNDKTMYSNAS